MKTKLLKLSSWIFAIGFVINGIAFTLQGIEIIRTGNSQAVSLATFGLFAALNINGIIYSYFILKDKTVVFGTTLGSLGCIFVIILKLIYG
jgi:hypothetical protein